MFIRVYNGDVELTVEQQDENVYEMTIVDGPDNKHTRMLVDRDFIFELQAKLQVVVENTED